MNKPERLTIFHIDKRSFDPVKGWKSRVYAYDLDKVLKIYSGIMT
ncbi:hypothetical protein [Paenibacillus selenitireducens]|nr:hypothetical protein [Paenibacillus selenitireducens]